MKEGIKRWEQRLFWGLAMRSQRADGRPYVRIVWGRLLLGCVILSIICWVSLFSAVFLYFKYIREDFKGITYIETLLLPFRLEAHQKMIGDYHIEQGLLALEEDRLGEALRLLRLGLARSQSNIRGRRALAQLYHEVSLQEVFPRELVLLLLEDGMPYGKTDIAYLKLYFDILFDYEQDERVLEIAHQVLSEERSPQEIVRLAALAAASACYYRGRDTEADAYLRDYHLQNTLDGAIVAARMLWDRGQRREAVDRLEASLKRFHKPEPLLELLVHFCSLMEDYPRVLRYATLRLGQDSKAYEPRLALISAYHDSGSPDAAQRETKSFIRQFRKNPSALLALSKFAIKTHDVSLSQRLYETSIEFGMPQVSLLAVDLVECVLSARDYQAVIELIGEFVDEGPSWLSTTYGIPIFNALRAVAYHGQGDAILSQSHFNRFFQEDLSIESMVGIAGYFQEHGAEELARQILLRAYQKDQNRQSVLTPLIQTELALGYTQNLSTYFVQMLQLRLPPQEFLENAYIQLAKDYFMFVPGREAILDAIGALTSKYKASS